MKWKRKLSIAGIVLGGLLTCSPIVGLVGTFIGMRRAFDTLGNSGIGDPQKLSDGIGTTLISTVLGIAVLPIGILLLVVSIVSFVRLSQPAPPPPPNPPTP
jgi:biopolymer transport protein ExbB/TolQ